MSYGTLSAVGGHLGWRLTRAWHAGYEIPVQPELPGPEPIDPIADEGAAPTPKPDHHVGSEPTQGTYLEKIRDFDRTYADDIIADGARLELLESAARRLTRVQKVFGHGNFNLMSFDTMIQVARRYRKIGAFPRQELDFLDELFHTDATDYGFYGDKVLTDMTAVIPERDTVKVSGTGHYLFRGEPLEKYERMCRDLDGNIFLTSGIRNVIKQMQLFLDKAVSTEGNLSQASRSLAPPGYSYHAVGDFDIGKIGAGLDNFNESFAETDVYKKLVDLGYTEFRYTETNPFGVRHEPWHIKMEA